MSALTLLTAGAAIVLVPVMILAIVYLLAINDMFWTILREGQAKTFLQGGQFWKMIMSLGGHDFKSEGEMTSHNVDYWDITEVSHESEPASEDGSGDEDWSWELFRKNFLNTFPFLTGIRWVGVWPFQTVYTYSFTFASIEQQAGEGGEVKNMLKVTEHDDPGIDYILVQSDIYGHVMQGMETQSNMEVDVIIAFRARVINPYKALFRINKWLEAIENRVTQELRPIIGELTFDQVVSLKGTSENGDDIYLDKGLQGVIKQASDDWGVEISDFGIIDVEISDKRAREAQNAQFIAKQFAEADKLEGAGLAERAAAFYAAVAKVQGGPQMLAAESIRDSNLRALSTGGGGILPTIDVGETAGSSGGDNPQSGQQRPQRQSRRPRRRDGQSQQTASSGQ